MNKFYLTGFVYQKPKIIENKNRAFTKFLLLRERGKVILPILCSEVISQSVYLKLTKGTMVEIKGHFETIITKDHKISIILIAEEVVALKFAHRYFRESKNFEYIVDNFDNSTFKNYLERKKKK